MRCLSNTVRANVTTVKQCPRDMNNQSIEIRKRAHTINTVTLSQFRGWTLFSELDVCVYNPTRPVPFKKHSWKMKLAFASEDTPGLSFAVITIPQPSRFLAFESSDHPHHEAGMRGETLVKASGCSPYTGTEIVNCFKVDYRSWNEHDRHTVRWRFQTAHDKTHKRDPEEQTKRTKQNATQWQHAWLHILKIQGTRKQR